MLYIISLLYKLYTLLVEQKKLPILDIHVLTGFFFPRIHTLMKALILRTSTFTWVLVREKNHYYPYWASSKLFTFLFYLQLEKNLIMALLFICSYNNWYKCYRFHHTCTSYQGQIQGEGAHPARTPLKLEQIWFFGVKSWFFTRNTPTFFVPLSARRNFLSAPPP